MFNLFPKKKTVDEILEDAGTTRWASLYQEVVDKNNELLKEVLQLRHLKKENVELMERVNEIDNDVIRDLQDEILVLKNDYAVLKAKFFKERDEYKAEVEKLKKDIVDYVLEKDDKIEKLKAQKHPMYPIHWGDYDKNIIEFVESEFNNGDPIESVYNLLKKAKDLTKDIEGYVFEKDNQVNFFEEEFNRLKPITKEKYDQIPVIGDTDRINNLLQKAKDLTKDVEVDLDKPLDEQSDKQPKNTQKKVHMSFPNEVPYEWEECTITGYKVPKEKSWEEAASDLALRVVKLEQQLQIHKLLIDQLNNNILCQK